MFFPSCPTARDMAINPVIEMSGRLILAPDRNERRYEQIEIVLQGIPVARRVLVLSLREEFCVSRDLVFAAENWSLPYNTS